MSKSNIKTLQRRSKLLLRLRQFFVENEYWEIETPLLSHDTCIDRWLEPFELSISGERCFLQTSPEFAMKRLLCQGADSIFQICKSFRAGEVGENHNPEFSMVEWYSQRLVLSDQIDFVERLVKEVLNFSMEQNWIPSTKPIVWQRMTYEEAFRNFAGLSAFDATDTELLNIAEQHGWKNSDSRANDRDDLLNYLLANVVEPELANLGVVSLTEYPASQSALAKIVHKQHPVAERFEMYLNGVEICNGYQELTDPVELRRRMELENSKRVSHGDSQLPVDSHLLEEMERNSLPECSGVALGFDRLVMICLGCNSLRDVIAFPFDIA